MMTAQWAYFVRIFTQMAPFASRGRLPERCLVRGRTIRPQKQAFDLGSSGRVHRSQDAAINREGRRQFSFWKNVEMKSYLSVQPVHSSLSSIMSPLEPASSHIGSHIDFKELIVNGVWAKLVPTEVRERAMSNMLSAIKTGYSEFLDDSPSTRQYLFEEHQNSPAVQEWKDAQTRFANEVAAFNGKPSLSKWLPIKDSVWKKGDLCCVEQMQRLQLLELAFGNSTLQYTAHYRRQEPISGYYPGTRMRCDLYFQFKDKWFIAANSSTEQSVPSNRFGLYVCALGRDTNELDCFAAVVHLRQKLEERNFTRLLVDAGIKPPQTPRTSWFFSSDEADLYKLELPDIEQNG